MKKIVRLTESDLTKIIRRVINEQTVLEPFEDPIQKPFWDYVREKWRNDEDLNDTAEFDNPDDNWRICQSGCGTLLPGTDANTVIWDYKNGVVKGTKAYGIDPKPMPIKSPFNVMKQWFDSNFKSTR